MGFIGSMVGTPKKMNQILYKKGKSIFQQRCYAEQVLQQIAKTLYVLSLIRVAFHINTSNKYGAIRIEFPYVFYYGVEKTVGMS